LGMGGVPTKKDWKLSISPGMGIEKRKLGATTDLFKARNVAQGTS